MFSFLEKNCPIVFFAKRLSLHSTAGINKTMTKYDSVSTRDEYKEYFEQNNLKGNNYETAKFIQFLMGKKTKGREIEELTGIKHSQITSYKRIIKSGKMEELRNKFISKVFKSIEKSPKEDEKIIFGIENLKLDDILADLPDEDESENGGDEEEEELSWEENLKILARRYENEYTEELELIIADMEAQNRELRNEIKKLKRKRSVGLDEEQKKTIEELRSDNEKLRNENTSLLAYKKFFEDMMLKMSEFP